MSTMTPTSSMRHRRRCHHARQFKFTSGRSFHSIMLLTLVILMCQSIEVWSQATLTEQSQEQSAKKQAPPVTVSVDDNNRIKSTSTTGKPQVRQLTHQEQLLERLKEQMAEQMRQQEQQQAKEENLVLDDDSSLSDQQPDRHGGDINGQTVDEEKIKEEEELPVEGQETKPSKILSEEEVNTSSTEEMKVETSTDESKESTNAGIENPLHSDEQHSEASEARGEDVESAEDNKGTPETVKDESEPDILPVDREVDGPEEPKTEVSGTSPIQDGSHTDKPQAVVVEEALTIEQVTNEVEEESNLKGTQRTDESVQAEVDTETLINPDAKEKDIESSDTQPVEVTETKSNVAPTTSSANSYEEHGTSSRDKEITAEETNDENEDAVQDEGDKASDGAPKTGSLAEFFDKANSKGSQFDALNGAKGSAEQINTKETSRAENEERLSSEKKYIGTWGIPKQNYRPPDLDLLYLVFQDHIDRMNGGSFESKTKESIFPLGMGSEEDPRDTGVNDEDLAEGAQRSVNSEFVEGLDDLNKFFEGVDPPDELDVGAGGSSIQDVLMGQGKQIIVKRITVIYQSTKKGAIVVKTKAAQILKKIRSEEGINLDWATFEEIGQQSLEVAKSIYRFVVDFVGDLLDGDGASIDEDDLDLGDFRTKLNEFRDPSENLENLRYQQGI